MGGRAEASEQEVRAAKKALDRAGTAEDAAERRFSAASAQFDRICKRAERHYAGKCVPRKRPRCCFHWQAHVREAGQTLDNAMLACKDAEISALQRHIEWRDALDAQQELEQELFHEQNDRYIRLLEKAVETDRER